MTTLSPPQIFDFGDGDNKVTVTLSQGDHKQISIQGQGAHADEALLKIAQEIQALGYKDKFGTMGGIMLNASNAYEASPTASANEARSVAYFTYDNAVKAVREGGAKYENGLKLKGILSLLGIKPSGPGGHGRA